MDVFYRILNRYQGQYKQKVISTKSLKSSFYQRFVKGILSELAERKRTSACRRDLSNSKDAWRLDVELNLSH